MPTEPAHPATGAPATGTRRGELDVLRALVVLGLVFFHAALVFSPTTTTTSRTGTRPVP
ncbi:hypothetical protein [Streptomyces actuosus]|uniref:hypothetical protein n=1 Tax=Streptomyces actuosus TaxID=1885 RepID=UPI00268EB087